MTRKLILITYDGGSSNFLPGVEKDREAFLTYFKSHTGGSYMPGEIVEFHNDPMLTSTLFDSTIYSFIHNQSVECITIVFCGHGYGASNGNTFMVFGPKFTCSIMRLSTICSGVETLVIADCCREVQIASLKRFSISNQMFNVAYATEYNQFAIENGKGGLYSQNLIKSGCLKQLPPPSRNYSIASVHQLASVWTTMEYNNQNPQITGNQISGICFSYK